MYRLRYAPAVHSSAASRSRRRAEVPSDPSSSSRVAARAPALVAFGDEADLSPQAGPAGRVENDPKETLVAVD